MASAGGNLPWASAQLVQALGLGGKLAMLGLEDRDKADWSLKMRSQRGRGFLASLDAEEADIGGGTWGGFR